MRRFLAASKSLAVGFGGTSIVSRETGMSRGVIVNLIAATSSKMGLKVRAQIDPNRYPSGIKVSDERFAALNIERDAFHAEWNYKLSPKL